MNHTTLLAKTDTGLRVLKDRSVPLAPRQRSAFIMFDGKHTLGEVLQALAGMGVVAEDVEALGRRDVQVAGGDVGVGDGDEDVGDGNAGDGDVGDGGGDGYQGECSSSFSH